MIKLRILNMKEFLKVINECTGAVNVIYPDGRKENINKGYKIQQKLQENYRKNKNSLTLYLDVSNPKDYISVVHYYAGDC